jgi:uncharacterized Zn finger protein
MTLDEKAERLVRAGAVRVVSRDLSGGDPLPHVYARVTGDTATYDVELGGTGENTCTCPLFVRGHRRRCAHIRALQLYERVGDLWAAEERALLRTNLRRLADGPPLGNTKTRETRWAQDRKGRSI